MSSNEDNQDQDYLKYTFPTSLIQTIKEYDVNSIDYSTEIYAETRQYLISKISQEVRIIQFLKFLVNLTKKDNKFIICGSNAFSILFEMNANLTNQNFENIQTQNTSLIGGNFAKCNLSKSKFFKVNINGINLGGAESFDVCFSPDETLIASGSKDKSIRLWVVKTAEQKAKLVCHAQPVYSVCFSPDGNSLASGSYDWYIRLWNAKTGEQKVKLVSYKQKLPNNLMKKEKLLLYIHLKQGIGLGFATCFETELF
ncbi:unnamed protein product [Paramecium pentaurelia]|uniref:Uncharacterized protein n=1 Tax=Paramecium pentaurelia TaxID=43138 RepID=A0A8S1X6B3_9CILI|nr:unnamed protein product [Paramecium pentaurelia]